MLPATLMALTYCVMYVVTGRLSCSVEVHAAFNAFSVVAPMIPVARVLLVPLVTLPACIAMGAACVMALKHTESGSGLDSASRYRRPRRFWSSVDPTGKQIEAAPQCTRLILDARVIVVDGGRDLVSVENEAARKLWWHCKSENSGTMQLDKGMIVADDYLRKIKRGS